MNNFTKFLFVIIIIFFINVIFFTISSDYRFLLQKIKSPNEVVYVNNDEINDNEPTNKEIEEKILKEASIVKNKDESNSTYKNNKNIINSKNFLGKEYTRIIDSFSGYNLGEIEIKSNLFDITNEYPDLYFEFYSKELTLYLFPTKSYEEIKNIIEVISYKQIFKVNEVNNLGDKSFYINLNSNYDDGYIRVVILNKSVTFGLKIKKDEYNKIKEIIKFLK